MKIEELQGKTHDQLKDMALLMKKELFNLRFQRATGELASTARFRAVRRDIARVYTAMNMPEGVAAKAPKAKKAASAKEGAPKAATKPAAKKAAKA